MFDELLRELKRLSETQRVSVPLHSDAEGYLDRECPAQECQFDFKVFEEDWRDKVRNEEVFCPFCGHTAPSDQWHTQEQVAAAKEVAVDQLQGRINTAMKRDADQWNRRQHPDAFMRITMKVDSRPQHVFLPNMAAEPMRLKITCPACACRYAVIGAAFFCPACGHNAADLMFTQSISGIRNALDALPGVRAAIPDRDVAETTVRLIIENGLQNAITAFQRYAEVLYATRYPSLPAPRRNVFQNLSEGSSLWHAASGKQYSDYVTTAELNALTRYFQQRHLLAHREGLVDADYITRSGDTSYREGQRLVVRDASVRECLSLIEKLASSIAS
ncbi:MAG: hypothetical protein IH605_01010 [Burkholderiales bacterium]|nr:hypothetical protein [Burkholderiales bacterium]